MPQAWQVPGRSQQGVLHDLAPRRAVGFLEHRSIVPSWGLPAWDASWGASEGAILFLTGDRALTYATPHSPWPPVERACTPYAPCYQGKGAGGARLNARGCGRAVTGFGALHAAGPAVAVQLCPDVPAVDSGTKEQEEGRDGGAP